MAIGIPMAGGGGAKEELCFVALNGNKAEPGVTWTAKQYTTIQTTSCKKISYSITTDGIVTKYASSGTTCYNIISSPIDFTDYDSIIVDIKVKTSESLAYIVIIPETLPSSTSTALTREKIIAYDGGLTNVDKYTVADISGITGMHRICIYHQSTSGGTNTTNYIALYNSNPKNKPSETIVIS